MERFVIKGGQRLKGEIRVNGAKNAALKILAASLLTDKAWTISNIPQIEDVFRLLELLKNIGVQVEEIGSRKYQIQAKQVKTSHLRPEIANKLKGSILMAGPLLARFGKAELPQPGGCVIGQRPRDIFLEGFKSFGVKISRKGGCYQLQTSQLKGGKFVFPLVSVTATETMILTAVLAKGKTKLINAACEPEIVFLADFLNQCGAKIQGAGTPHIDIEGVSSLRGGKCEIIPDRIEAGSFVLLAAALKSSIKVTNIIPEHLEAFWFLLDRAGVNFELSKNFVKVKPGSRIKAVNMKTHEYPGFPTDLQAPFVVLMTQAKGISLIHETIFDGRLFYTDILNQMGARIIMCDPHRVIVQGPARLFGRKLISPDIRAGIALVIAALVARGESVIENIYQIDRGYENIEQRLQKLGAGIKRLG